MHAITDEEWAQISPLALAQNIACRLVGYGGWESRGVYSTNSTVQQQVVNACFGAETSRDPLAYIKEFIEDSEFEIVE